MRREYRFYVYMVQSSSRRALYIGMTNNLGRRVFEHKNHHTEGFTDQYNAVRLVYFELYDDVYKAIAREKQMKNWRREKKLWLIARFNPGRKDLAVDWYESPPERRGMFWACRLRLISQRTQGPSTCPRLRSGQRSG